MIPDHLSRALDEFQQGVLSRKELESFLEGLPYQDLGYAKVDHHRAIRQGFPEVIFGRGKTPEQIVGIARNLLEHHPNLLITRGGRAAFAPLKDQFPEAEYHAGCEAITVVREPKITGRGLVGVVSAGTADIPVAEEAMVTARTMGNEVFHCYDVGVAGIHRVLSRVQDIRACSVVVAVAGMEGALPSVVGGLVAVPVIAVPTSIGYGASFGGLAALLGMLNSCSSNVTVVNIDNGFGAGFVASLINRPHESS
jgi:pyridinium-3,5-biscarboxylic acid mononucleotide synthase